MSQETRITGDPMHGEEVTPLPLARRRPAELTTFVAALVVAAGAVGLDLTTEAILAAFVVVGTLPAIVTWAVNLYRDAARDLSR